MRSSTPPRTVVGAAVIAGVLTVLRVPRAGGEAVRLTRLLPVVLFVGSAVALAMWRAVVAVQALTPGAPTAVLSTVLLCLAWPLVWAGLVLLPASAAPLDPLARAAAERRSTAVTVAAVVVAAVLVVTGPGARSLDLVTTVLLAGAGMLAVAATAREATASVAADLVEPVP